VVCAYRRDMKCLLAILTTVLYLPVGAITLEDRRHGRYLVILTSKKHATAVSSIIVNFGVSADCLFSKTLHLQVP
jgi:hypothetical protein